VPAEAVRVVLEGLRTIDTGLGTALDDLASALGMLAPADSTGHRAVLAPLRLFDDPAGWFTRGDALSVVAGGPFDAERVIDLLEALKPFVGLDGTPRGVWPIADGLQVTATSTAAGATVGLTVDAGSWLAGDATRAPFAAGLSASLALASSGHPHPSVEVFLGIPDGPGGTSTPQHRRAAHAVVDGSGLRLFLRPAAGADIEVFPHLAGLASLLGAGIDAVLPIALNELAKLSGDSVRDTIAALVSGAGQGLAIASTASPAVFDGAAIKALAADPAAYLRPPG
jgi:large repetitive protein